MIRALRRFWNRLIRLLRSIVANYERGIAHPLQD